MSKRIGLALLLLTSAGAIPVFAAVQLQPGEWQTTETGTENGKSAPPRVEKDCMSATEARDATTLVNEMKKEMTEQGAKCQQADIRQSGDTVSYAFKCAGAQHMAFDLAGTFTLLSSTRYSGRLKMEMAFAGQKMTSDKAIEGVRVGECNPGAGKKK